MSNICTGAANNPTCGVSCRVFVRSIQYIYIVAKRPNSDSNTSDDFLAITRHSNVTATWDAATSTCVNAVRDISYTILYDSAGGLFFVVLNITHENATAINDVLVIHQTFSMSFLPENDNTPILAPNKNYGNGFGGYAPQSPVQAAIYGNGSTAALYVNGSSSVNAEDSTAAYNRVLSEDGLTVMSTGPAGQCVLNHPLTSVSHLLVCCVVWFILRRVIFCISNMWLNAYFLHSFF
jgi:hypothetical protein